MDKPQVQGRSTLGMVFLQSKRPSQSSQQPERFQVKVLRWSEASPRNHVHTIHDSRSPMSQWYYNWTLFQSTWQQLSLSPWPRPLSAQIVPGRAVSFKAASKGAEPGKWTYYGPLAMFLGDLKNMDPRKEL